MRTLFGMGWRLILFGIVIAALVVSPLFLVYRSKCLENGKRVDSWSFVAPVGRFGSALAAVESRKFVHPASRPAKHSAAAMR